MSFDIGKRLSNNISPESTPVSIMCKVVPKKSSLFIIAKKIDYIHDIQEQEPCVNLLLTLKQHRCVLALKFYGIEQILQYQHFEGLDSHLNR